MDLNFITSFIFGGFIYSIIYYASHYMQNTALSAIASLLPVGILACLVMHDRNIIIGHTINLIPVLIITLISIVILVLLLEFTLIGINQSIFIAVFVGRCYILRIIYLSTLSI